MGRVCSALPGSMVCGMGAPDICHDGPVVGGGALSIPVPADLPTEACGGRAQEPARASRGHLMK